MNFYGIPSKQVVMALFLLVALGFALRSLMAKSKSNTSAIDLDDLLLEWDAGANRLRMSVLRCTFLGCFVFSIWLMVYLTLAGKMTEGYLGIFNLAWVAPLTSAIIWGKKPPLPAAGPTTAITADSVTVKQ